MEKLLQNEYRILKMCSNCPFRTDGNEIKLDDGRMDEIISELLSGETFVCHKTVYREDKTQSRKTCAGAFEFLKKEKKPNEIMLVAKSIGYEDWETV